MILKAKERGDGGQLARYLLATRDNEHVELHEVSGFVSDELIDALHEADAIARGTRCKNYLFSMSLNPPEGAYVETEVFERAADQIGKKLPLGYKYLGEQTVKNIEKPVRAYRILMAPEYAGKVIGDEPRKSGKWPRTAVAAVVGLPGADDGYALCHSLPLIARRTGPTRSGSVRRVR